MDASKSPEAAPPAEEVARAVLSYSLSLPRGAATLWPCLIGPTGAGKTALAAALASEAGLDIAPVLLGTMQPEDVSGIPRPVGDPPTLQWALPAWAASRSLIFMDELDKARPEHFAAVLTLLTGREVRGRPLPDGTAIMAAMQPVEVAEWLSDQTGQALAARLVFVPVGYGRAHAHLRQRHGLTLDWLPAEREPALPLLPAPSPRQIDWLAGFAAAHRARPDLVAAVVRGICAPALVEHLLADIDRSADPNRMAPGELIQLLAEDPSRIARLTPATLAIIWPEAWMHQSSTPQVLEGVTKRILSELTPEEILAAQKALMDTMRSRADANGEVAVLGDTAEDDVISALWRASTGACAERLARHEASKGSTKKRGGA